VSKGLKFKSYVCQLYDGFDCIFFRIRLSVIRDFKFIDL